MLKVSGKDYKVAYDYAGYTLYPGGYILDEDPSNLWTSLQRGP